MANTEVGAAYVTIMPSMKGFSKEVANGVKGASNAFSGFASVAKTVGAAVASIGIAKAAKDFAGFALSTASAAETTEISFTTMLGSAEAAQQMISTLSDFAAKTPFELSGLQDATRQLLAYGFQAEEIIPMLTAVGDATSALGTGQAGIESVTRALGQMQTRGKVSAEEMLQLTEAGIPAWQYLAEAIGTDTAGAMQKVTDGAVSASQGIEAITTGMERDFGGMMEAQSKTLTGIMSNLSDAIERPLMALKDTSGYQALTTALSGLVDVAGPLVEKVLPLLDAGMSAAARGISAAVASIPVFTSGLSSIGGAVRAAMDEIGNIISNASQLWSIGDTLPQKLNLVLTYLKNVASQGMQGLTDAVTGALDGIGQKFTALQPVTDFITNLIDSAGGLGGIISQIAGVAAAFQALKFVGGLVGPITQVVVAFQRFSMLSSITGTISALQASFGRLLPSLSGVSGILSAFASPVGIAVAAVAALAAGFAYFYTTSESFRNSINGIVQGALTTLSPTINSIALTLTTFAQTVMPMVMSAINALAPVLMQIITIAAQILAVVVPAAAQIASAVITAATSILSIVLPVISTIVSTVAPAVQGILSVVQSAISIISSVVLGVTSTIQAAVSTFCSDVQTIWSGLWSFVQSFVSSAWSNVQSAVSSGVSGVISTVSSLPGKIQSFFADAGNWLVNAGRSIIQGLIDGIKSMVGTAVDAASGVVSQIRAFFPFSPAKRGPFSGHGYTTYSGRALMRDWAGGMVAGGGYAVKAVNGVMGDVQDAFAYKKLTRIQDSPNSAAAYSSDVYRYRGAEELSKAIDGLRDGIDRLDGMGVYMDDGKLVGAISKKMNRSLGRMQRRSALS